MIAPGSSVQVIVAIIIILINLLLCLKLEPFQDSADDFLSVCTSVQMIFTLLVAILLKTAPDSEYYDAAFMDATLIVVNSFSVLAFLFSIIAMHPKVRAKINSFGTKIDNVATVSVDATDKKVSIVPVQAEAAKQRSASTKPAAKPAGRTPEEVEEEATKLRVWGV